MRKQCLEHVRLIVVKVGTGTLTNEKNRPDPERMAMVVNQIAQVKKRGLEVILVSSGAVGSGMGALGYEKRPRDLARLQACAAVGQSHLMAAYQHLFNQHQICVAQVLLTHDDLRHKERHLNARNTLQALLAEGAVPVINENDAVSFTELKFGDNDRLSALVACLLPADLLVILTSVEGVIRDFGSETSSRISLVETIDDSLMGLAGGTQSLTSVGGMTTKLDAARISMRSGIPVVIASGSRPDVLERILAFEDEGTLFRPGVSRLKGRKRWIAFFNRPKGSLTVDDGAREALRNKGKSLLSPGITHWEGPFEVGDVVSVRDIQGIEFARGMSNISSIALEKGQKTSIEIIHRDNLVIL